MNEIRLNGPKSSEFTALVSPEDFVYLSGFKWYLTRGYPSRSASKRERLLGSPKTVYMHLVVAERAGKRVPGQEVDHKDVNPLNCTRDNLRPATRRFNQVNNPRHRDNKSGFKGVTKHTREGKWRANIYI